MALSYVNYSVYMFVLFFCFFLYMADMFIVS